MQKLSFHLLPKQWYVCTLFMTAVFIFIYTYQDSIKRLNLSNFVIREEHIEGTPPNHIEGTPPNDIHCYREQGESLPDISEISPRPGKSIFFHETSCRSFNRGKISITSRQACSVESAARLNPDLDIYLLYSSPGVFKFNQFFDDESDDFLKALLSYKNVKIMHLNVEKYIQGTPVEELYTSGKMESSDYVVSHSSDVMRFLTLWKYGGIYLDLDILVLKSLQDLPLNFAGIESSDTIGSAVLSFAPDGIGHTLVEKCLINQRNGFSGTEWGTNGPGVITRTLNEHCEVQLAIQMLDKDCKGMKIYPDNKFYAIPYQSWTLYFREEYLNYVNNVTQNSYTVHIWNKLSVNEKINISSNAPYLDFGRKYCPNVVKSCKQYF